MDYFSAGLKVLFLLTFCVHLSSAGTHSLLFFYTAVTPGINLPQFTALSFVDGEQSEYYDSNIRKAIPKTEWIKKIDVDVPKYWISETEIWQEEEEWLKLDVTTLAQLFNKSKRIHNFEH